MINWLKKYFVPHVGNEHRPHVLRTPNIRNLVALVIFLEIFTFLIPALTQINLKGGMAAVLPGALSFLTNEERQSQHLQTLSISPTLNKAAQMKAEDMATEGYFAHTSPEGKTPWYWLDQVGYKYKYAGENLAVNFSDSKDVTEAWMKSPTHRENIEKKNYTEIGTGVATGTYEGRQSIFVAQVYANPLPKKITPEPKKQVALKPTEEKTSKVDSVNSMETTNVLGAETIVSREDQSGATTVDESQPQNPTFWQKLLVSPRNTMNVILFVVFGIMSATLLVYIVVKAKQYHLDLVTNGLIVLAIIGAIFVANYYLSNRNMVITQSLDYSYEHN